MVLYLDRSSNQILANYFDSEGQQITYKVTPSSDHEAVTFLSEPSAFKPRYRLTYRKVKDGTLNGKFEIAPSGQPELKIGLRNNGVFWCHEKCGESR